jgi:hypothetical protein
MGEKRLSEEITMPFTHWMIFGQPKKAYTQDEAKKTWGEFKKALKEGKLELMGPWGPFGVPEGMSFMLKGKNADFEKYIGSEAWQKCPLEKTRTISLFTMPWD